nr:G patch domain-containing protein 11 [Pinctada fucata]
MGYKPGMSLGKKGEGRSEPVPIEIHAGRGGLGRDSGLKRRAESVNAARQDALKKRLKLDSQRKDKFLQRMSEKYTGQQTDRDLVKSQKVCLQLDQQQEFEHPVRKFYWPKNSLPKETQSQEIDDFDDDFDDDGPPSISRQRKDEEEEDDVEEEEELDEDDDICGVDKLQMLTQYLREQYFYCVWCGTRYDDADDLESNCPGDTSEDHDD